MLQQMFEVTAARFHTVTQTFAPLIDSVVDDTLLQTGPYYTRSRIAVVYTRSCITPRSLIHRVEVWAVWRPQVWGDELRR